MTTTKTPTKTPRGLVVSRAYLEQAYQEARALVRGYTERIEEKEREGDLEHVETLKRLQWHALGRQSLLDDIATQAGLFFKPTYDQGFRYPLKKERTRKGGGHNA